ncbi:MAG: hypothetical protein IJ323_07330 [Clostridia bacterium]|nr:hypothetical protein [Clostridia bacterium]
MTILDEVKETFKNVETGKEFTTFEIKQMVNQKFGRTYGSIIPSDYSYNMTNKGKIGTLKNFNIFLQVKIVIYNFVGEN